MKTFNNSISTTFPISIPSTQPYDLSTVDMFGFDTKQKIREPSFHPQLSEYLYFKPFPHITYLSLTSTRHSPHEIIRLFLGLFRNLKKPLFIGVFVIVHMC